MTEIYHITHVDNLPAIIAAGRLLSDRKLIQEQGERVVIGFDHIKDRRLNNISVPCNPKTLVGDYVPFYFCPRSVMLYVIHRRSTELQYRGGQGEIVHLVSTVETAFKTVGNRPWAFSDGNAGAFYTQFYNDAAQMNQILDWKSIHAANWSDPAIKEKKQTEFLVYDYYLWENFHEIGVYNQQIAQKTLKLISFAGHKPIICVHPDWYY